MAVMIGIDPHKGSHTAVAVGAAEEQLGKLRVRACPAQAEKLVAWARAWPERTWARRGRGRMTRIRAAAGTNRAIMPSAAPVAG
jgi:transposase